MTEKTYSNFDELFNDVSRNVDNYYSGDSFIQRLNKEILNCYFNDWLQEVKGFKYSNAEEYKAFLNKKTMLEYLEYEGEQESIRLVEAEKEKESWQPQQPKVVKPDEVKKEPKKPAEKWYALLYWIELNANGEQPPKNSEGAFIKSEIEAIRKKVTGKSGQSFYRAFIGIDLNNEKSIKLSFGKEWKKQIIELSKNNSKIIDYIQSKYTS